MLEVPKMIPFQKEIFLHQKKFPDHKSFRITGTKKKEKIRGAFCKKCKKYISKIQLLSSKKRRR